jgi:PKD repeat protein
MIQPFRLGLGALFLFLLSATPGYSLQLFDGDSFLYDIGTNGALMRGTRDAYAGMYHLRVKGTNYIGNISSLSDDGREVRRQVFVEPGSGLEIQRYLYVPKTENFARFSEILRNPTDAPITVDVEVYGKLGAGNRTVKAADQGHFLMTDEVIDNQSGSTPALLHYHSQVNSPVTASHNLRTNQLSWIYSGVTVPAQSQVRLMYFVAQTKDVDTAQQVATLIFNNPSVLYENMGPAAREQSLNFKAPQAIARDGQDADLSNAPFLNLGELRNGQLDDQDAWSLRRLATPADAYALNLAADETVTIRMSAYFNAYLYLFQDSKGETLVAGNDDSGTNTTNAEIVFTATESGTYYIEATAHNRDERGAYALEILDGAINRPPNAYPFEFQTDNATAPAIVTVTDFSTDSDGDIEERCWQFGDGSPIVCDNSHTMTHTYQQAGRYQVGLTVRDNHGAYAYHNESLSIGATPDGIVLRVSNTVPGELASSDSRSQTRTQAFADRYRISAVTVGQELVIEMTSNDFDGYLYLYDASNRLLHQDDNSGGGNQARLRYTPMQSGELLVEATSFHDHVLGRYTLTLELANQQTAIQVPIEVAPTLDNPLRYQFMARLPDSFDATFLRWDFGDNSPEIGTEQAVVSYTYQTPGTVTVTVIATNEANQEAVGSLSFTVNDQMVTPQARFRASPLFGEKPLRVFFNNESAPNSELPNDQLTYLWQFGDGEVSTDTHPAHTFRQGGTYHVTLQVISNLTRQRASYSLPITVIDRQSADVPMIGKVRELPQVLMAGFDPILVDLLDTDVKIFAIVRPGKTPLATVRFIANGTDFGLVMQQVATYSNGDQRYETVFTYPQGLFSVMTLDNLFGEQTGQYRIQAIDQAGQFHAFPNLEIGNNPPLDTTEKSLNIEPLHQAGIRRRQPQVLAAGFDPILVHKSPTTPSLTVGSEAELMVKAIVRQGLFPIQRVTLAQQGGGLILPMRLQETLPNGDQLYVVNYSYPADSLQMGTLGNLFGVEAGQFTVTVVDRASQTHRYPEVLIGNYPQQ